MRRSSPAVFFFCSSTHAVTSPCASFYFSSAVVSVSPRHCRGCEDGLAARRNDLVFVWRLRLVVGLALAEGASQGLLRFFQYRSVSVGGVGCTGGFAVSTPRRRCAVPRQQSPLFVPTAVTVCQWCPAGVAAPRVRRVVSDCGSRVDGMRRAVQSSVFFLSIPWPRVRRRAVTSFAFSPLVIPPGVVNATTAALASTSVGTCVCSAV